VPLAVAGAGKRLLAWRSEQRRPRAGVASGACCSSDMFGDLGGGEDWIPANSVEIIISHTGGAVCVTGLHTESSACHFPRCDILDVKVFAPVHLNDRHSDIRWVTQDRNGASLVADEFPFNAEDMPAQQT
jgi:hypothetical protein